MKQNTSLVKTKNTGKGEASYETRKRLQLSITFHLSFLEAMARKEDMFANGYSVVTEAAASGREDVFPLILAAQGTDGAAPIRRSRPNVSGGYLGLPVRRAEPWHPPQWGASLMESVTVWITQRPGCLAWGSAMVNARRRPSFHTRCLRPELGSKSGS